MNEADDPISIDLEKYDHVTSCSPIWAFSLAVPMRSFCRQAGEKSKEADYILARFSPGRYSNAATEIDALRGLSRTCVADVTCRVGKFMQKAGERKEIREQCVLMRDKRG